MDLTETAVEQLSKAYPDASFVRGDVPAPEVVGQFGAGSADAVSAMNVLFHIVDDAAFERALANVRDVLRPGGYFLYSDLLVHGKAPAGRHRACHGPLRLPDRRADPALRAAQRASRHQKFVLQVALVRRRALVSSSDRLGAVAGRRLYPLEIKPTSRGKESPTTELMVCRRR
jgi:SAM-dependent methyltransferase